MKISGHNPTRHAVYNTILEERRQTAVESIDVAAQPGRKVRVRELERRPGSARGAVRL